MVHQIIVKEMINKITSIVVILAVLAYIVYCEFFRSYKEYETVVEYIEIIDTIYIEKPVPYKVEIPVDVPYEVEVFDTIIDTIKVKEYVYDLTVDYNTKRYYSDTLDLDTLGVVIASSMVTRNELQYINFGVNIKMPHTIQTVRAYNIGAGIMAGPSNISPTLMFNRKRYVGIVNYNIIRNEASAGLIYKFN